MLEDRAAAGTCNWCEDERRVSGYAVCGLSVLVHVERADKDRGAVVPATRAGTAEWPAPLVEIYTAPSVSDGTENIKEPTAEC